MITKSSLAEKIEGYSLQQLYRICTDVLKIEVFNVILVPPRSTVSYKSCYSGIDVSLVAPDGSRSASRNHLTVRA